MGNSEWYEVNKNRIRNLQNPDSVLLDWELLFHTHHFRCCKQESPDTVRSGHFRRHMGRIMADRLHVTQFPVFLNMTLQRLPSLHRRFAVSRIGQNAIIHTPRKSIDEESRSAVLRLGPALRIIHTRMPRTFRILTAQDRGRHATEQIEVIGITGVALRHILQ